MSMPTVEMTGLGKRYRRTFALRDVSLRAGVGVTGLLGPNGAGKTTLLRIAATVLTPDLGAAYLFGLSPHSDDTRRHIRRQLGYLPQDVGIHRFFTAFEFVDYVAILKEMAHTRKRHQEVRRVLGLVGLADLAGRRVHTLSGGARRRLALAQALLGDPALLILDEPTAGLDPEQRLLFRELLSRLGEDRTVLLSSHHSDDLAALCGHIVVLREGRTVFAGPPAELTATARGRVWTSGTRDPGAMLAWRTGEGAYRNVGDPPPGVDFVAPQLEDAYLLLVRSP
ncbi:ATP-binding cassette domain-containing protein [Catenuloplanes japonicus]|uniref:ATP-binding cassette domain-containing protein n=1 Tax=Catenuloplanes japonicus TaxID=33876 RepID=UPI00068E9DAD|nr:ATP-binding cassette domain-containing protein [Catenuloplanes japonicus]